MTMGETINLFRKRKGLTQQELANRIGISAGTVLNYEKDKTVPDILILGVIMKELDIKSKDMFGKE